MFEKEVGVFRPYRVLYSRNNFIITWFAETLDSVQVTLGIFPAEGFVVVVLSL